MRNLLLMFAALSLLLAGQQGAKAQREYHSSDGPYHGLQCAADETVVPILGGVKCQKMPQCGPGQTLMPGTNGFECQVVNNGSSGNGATQTERITGAIPAIQATVVGLRFFVSFEQPTTRQYDDLFFYNAARYIYWELELVHPAPSRATSFTLQEVWYDPSGEVAHQAKRTFTIQPGWTDSSFYAGARLVYTKSVQTDNPLYYSCLDAQRRAVERGGIGAPCSATTDVDIQNWPMGTYHVDILVDGVRVATGAFSMLEKDDIYGEVAAKAADRSAPRGAIEPLGATVTALQFFESGDSIPNREQRQYTRQFSANSARHVLWELDLAHPPPHQWLALPFEALLYFQDATGERLVQRKVLQSAAPPDWANTYHSDYFGWEDDYYYYRTGAKTRTPGRWQAGTYYLDLYLGDTKIASGSFEMH